MSKMSETELLDEFERMLENMNLTEEKKEPLRRLQLAKKREMLTLHLRTNATVKVSNEASFNLNGQCCNHLCFVKNRFDTPSDFITYLSNHDLMSLRRSSCVESLRVALTSNGVDWIQDFGVKGLKLLLNLVSDCLAARW